MATTPPAAPPKAAAAMDIQTAPPKIGFTLNDVPPDQPIYLQDNDFVGFQSLTNSTLNSFVFRYRFLNTQGQIKEGTVNFNTTSFLNAFQVFLGEGWLISFGLDAGSGTPNGTWLYVQTFIGRGNSPFAGGNVLGMIWEGYVTQVASSGWPGSALQRPYDGGGMLRAITGTLPAAGSDIHEVVPTNRRWKLLGLRANLTTSATVANRFARFTLSDGGGIIYFGAGSSFAHVASTAINYAIFPGSQFFNDTNGTITVPFPNEQFLKPASIISTATIGIQAGDQWTAPLYLVQEWGQWDA